MDLIRVAKVDRLRLKWTGDDSGERLGTLHLTTHHLIFTAPGVELWLGYPLIHSAVLVRPPRLQQRRDTFPDDWVAAPVATGDDSSCESGGSSGSSSGKMAGWALEGSIKIRCHHFMFLTLRCEEVRQLYDVFATMKHLACVDSIDRLYAFSHRETETEVDGDGAWTWGVYDPVEEFGRMGVGSGVGEFWRFTDINRGFALCPTYPPVLVVPAKISDTTLSYAAKYRSKCRLPVLCYLHPNRASMTRSSQPMVGLKQARSVQDEKLVEAILASSEPQGSAPRFNYERNNIIIDARPTTNAVVNRAVGAGSENMEHYKRCRKVYLGIDNIHVMRDALNRVVEAIESTDSSGGGGGGGGGGGVVARIQGAKTGWLRHIENILVGVKTIVTAIDAGHHVVVHCSDGWDRTAQLTSLAQLCLDPYYRTIKGFAVLIEKEWVSFGHQFSLRCDHSGHPDRFKVSRAPAKRQAQAAAANDSAGGTPMAAPPSIGEDTSAGGGYDFLQSGTSMFGRFATKALRGVQSRITSAIQAASDNLDDLDDPDPFLAEYPELQAKYEKPAANGNGHGFKFGRTKHDHETSPVFQQFLECVYQLWVQHPTIFEFNEELLLDLFYHLHSAQFGTFMGNCARERTGFAAATSSIWTWVWRQLQGDERYLNPLYGEDEPRRVVVPDPGFIQYWSALFSCHDPTLKKENTKSAENYN
ncbi:phosphatidylinositol-3-phosphatase ymr1 [Coemansia sp. RSA 2050]|nr:phosphatidylinositol-3-phosphatase ymr1 [Coemansia sp. RSA 2050]KAJ2733001.1 phosphatidylinositol-3-phosphatase ymr1 [Coemansia sp. BCRC 34962]